MKILNTLLVAGAVVLPAAGPASAHEQQASNEDEFINEPVTFNHEFDRTAGDCNYTVKVTGTITPVTKAHVWLPPMVNPKLDVSAEASCPDVQTAKLSAEILGVRPLTWRQLANAISDHSEVITVEKNHECTYMGRFKVNGAMLAMPSFDHYCTAI
jgi:hypothetical protein